MEVIKPSIADIFETMDYGPALESDKVAQAWLEQRNRTLGHLVGNKVLMSEHGQVCVNPLNGQPLATTADGSCEDTQAAIEVAQKAFETWGEMSGHQRAKSLYNVARHVQKHSRLMAVMETLESGKSIKQTRDVFVPAVVRHLYYYAGWAELMQDPYWKSIGVVAFLMESDAPFMSHVLKVAAALASGNTVVLKPSKSATLSALLFSEICADAGLPAGVLNVITGHATKLFDPLPQNLDKLVYCGPPPAGDLFQLLSSASGLMISLELEGAKCPMIIFENADLDSAVECVMEASWLQHPHPGFTASRLLIQEPVYEVIIAKLRDRLSHFRIGGGLDKAVDSACLLVPGELRERVKKCVTEARLEGADVFQAPLSQQEEDADCPIYPPTLITNLNTASKVVLQDTPGPVLFAMPFRTAKEAISLANNCACGLAVSIHSEQFALALETAHRIKALNVWVNCHGVSDCSTASVGCGNLWQGGKPGLYQYLKPSWQTKVNATVATQDVQKFGLTFSADGPELRDPEEVGQLSHVDVDRTYKLYYGGGQKRPDGNYSAKVRNAQGQMVALVGQANSEDVKNAVEAAVKAQGLWAKRSGFNRSQILYYIAENLEVRKKEFAAQLTSLTGKKDGLIEVEKCIQRLFYWASFADKDAGHLQDTPAFNGPVLQMQQPVGVIGIICPDSYDFPLLSFVSLMAAAISRGNCVVMVPSERCPLPALDLYQILDTSDVPGGVVNVLSGCQDHLTRFLAKNNAVDGLWYFGSVQGSNFVQLSSLFNVKQTWVNEGQVRDWADDHQGRGQEFLHNATSLKTLYLPMGDIYAN